MSVFTKKEREQLKILREKKMTVDFIRNNNKRSKALIEGYKRGYEVGEEAWSHTYNARV